MREIITAIPIRAHPEVEASLRRFESDIVGEHHESAVFAIQRPAV
jgi:hypothetical protein